MPRNRSEQPAYSYHVSGQARVRLGGKVYYLGKHGMPDSYARYYALLAEYNANGKQPPGRDEGDVVERLADDIKRVRHVTELFRANKIKKYEGNQAMTNRYHNLCDLINERFGNEPVTEFGPLRLQELRSVIQQQGIGDPKFRRPNCRRQTNELTRNIVRIFKYGVSQQLVPAELLVALQSVEPLESGEGIDHAKRKPVPVEDVGKTLPFLTSTVQAMIRVQLAAGMRPGELFQMTPAMIDRTGPTWFYKPAKHKTEHHGKTRVIPLNEDAVAALTPYLFGDADELCFVTQKETAWNKDSYRRAITRAAERAGVPHWTPYRIRHATIQSVRDASGAEAAQAIAGHSRISTIERYSEVSKERAAEASKAAPRLG
ncbi:MAG: tyrosine-type recombinase/integrase [Planctomycetota bacterium]